jgi:hypothetical protein
LPQKQHFQPLKQIFLTKINHIFGTGDLKPTAYFTNFQLNLNLL